MRHARERIHAIVVGARCAGSPTAMLLAGRAYKVLLVDRARFPSNTISTHRLHPPPIAALTAWACWTGWSRTAAMTGISGRSERDRAVTVHARPTAITGGLARRGVEAEARPVDADDMVQASGAVAHRVFAGRLDKSLLGLGEIADQLS